MKGDGVYRAPVLPRQPSRHTSLGGLHAHKLHGCSSRRSCPLREGTGRRGMENGAGGSAEGSQLMFLGVVSENLNIFWTVTNETASRKIAKKAFRSRCTLLEIQGVRQVPQRRSCNLSGQRTVADHFMLLRSRNCNIRLVRHARTRDETPFRYGVETPI